MYLRLTLRRGREKRKAGEKQHHKIWCGFGADRGVRGFGHWVCGCLPIHHRFITLRFNVARKYPIIELTKLVCSLGFELLKQGQ